MGHSQWSVRQAAYWEEGRTAPSFLTCCRVFVCCVCVCVCVHVQGSVQSIVFLPNGKHMLTSGKIGTVLLYVYYTKHMIVV